MIKNTDIAKILRDYSDETIILNKIKDFCKKKIITPNMALHFELLVKDPEYFAEHIDKKVRYFNTKAPYKQSMTMNDRFGAALSLPTTFSLDMMALPSPLDAATDLILIEAIFVDGHSIIEAWGVIKEIATAYRQSIGDYTTPYFYESTVTMLGETRLLAQKTQCVDHFKIEKTISDLMRNTTISDKVPSAMVMPTRRVTLIELPQDSDIKIFNEMSGWHNLESITVVRNDHEAHSNADKFFPENIKKAAGVDGTTPFTSLFFYFDAKPKDGATYFDDANLIVTLLVKDLGKPIIDSLSEAMKDGSALKTDTITEIWAQDLNIELMEYSAEERGKDAIRLVRYAASIMLFVNSNYARREFVPAQVEQRPSGDASKVNKKKFGVKIQREAQQRPFTRLYFHSSRDDQRVVSDYLKDANADKRFVSLHWRSPHWRGQHYGQGNKQFKIILIPPSLVGADRADETALIGRNRKI